MQIKAVVLSAVAATGAVAWSVPNFNNGGLQGYPWGNPWCMNDQQAQFVVATFKSILTNPDRKAAGVTAQALLPDNYVETSDSINTLAGYPIGGASFNGKKAFIDGVVGAPAISQMDDLDIFHDCTKILWQWNVPHLALNQMPVKGMNKMVVNPATGQLLSNDIEFNSIAWGRDIGWTCTPPSGPPH